MPTCLEMAYYAYAFSYLIITRITIRGVRDTQLYPPARAVEL